MIGRRLLVAGVAALAVGAVGGTPARACPAGGSGGRRLAVPAYVAPGEDWARLRDAGGAVGIAVANAANGPGQYDAGYATAIAAARRAGISVLGYVDTGYFGTTGLATRDGGTG